VDRFLRSLRADAARVGAVVRDGDLGAPVAACPGWDVAELTRHLGFIHRWVIAAVRTGAAPDPAGIERGPAGPDGAALAGWLEAGAVELAGLLGELEPEAPTWHPFAAPRVARVWPRRQAHETMIHRWDAEHAVGRETPLDAALAADGVSEYFELIVPRVLGRDGRVAPAGDLRVELEDAATVLHVRSTGDTVTLVRPPPAGDGAAVLRGSAEDVALALWGRRPLAAAPHAPVARAWLAFGGN